MGTAVTLVKDSVPATRKARPAAPVTKGRRGRRENLAGYLFMSPWIAGFLTTLLRHGCQKRTPAKRERAIVKTCGSRSFRRLRAGPSRRVVQRVCR